MMTGRVGEYKREDKDDAPRPGASAFDSQKRVQAEKSNTPSINNSCIWPVDGQRL
jgi:hypothetical protein